MSQSSHHASTSAAVVTEYHTSRASAAHLALTRLPDVLLDHLFSFVTTRDVYRLAATCSALSRNWFPSRVELGWRAELVAAQEAGELELQHGSTAFGTLARRCAGKLKGLRIGDPRLIEPFFCAVRDGDPAVGLPLLTSLHVRLAKRAPGLAEAAPPIFELGYLVRVPQPCAYNAISEAGMQAMGEVLGSGQLPMLRELRLEMDGWEEASVKRLLIGAGSCPRLERIEIIDFPPTVFVELAAALQSRREGCIKPKALVLEHSGGRFCQGIEEACQALAGCLAACSLAELRCRGSSCPARLLDAMLLRLSSCKWPALQVLELTSKHQLRAQLSCDALLLALAREACPNLTRLELEDFRCSDESWLALGDAMTGLGSTCLKRFTTLRLRKIFHGRAQWEAFMRGIGDGHGCPELRELELVTQSDLFPDNEDVTIDDESPLAHALHPPRGLPRLQRLWLSMNTFRGVNEVVEALEQRPHATEALEELRLTAMDGERLEQFDTTTLNQALASGGGLSCLQELAIETWFLSRQEGAVFLNLLMQLVEALESGAGRHLETIRWGDPQPAAHAAVVNRILQAQASRGACPRLRCLAAYGHDPGSSSAIPPGRLDMRSLSAMLTGGAACSATLKDLDLSRWQLGDAELRDLESCFRDPGVVQLEALHLWVTDESALPALLDMLGALGGRAGSRLVDLSIRCQRQMFLSKPTPLACTQEVVQRLVDTIDAAGLPAFAVSSPCRVPKVVGSGSEGEALLTQAVHRRRKAAWLASW